MKVALQLAIVALPAVGMMCADSGSNSSIEVGEQWLIRRRIEAVVLEGPSKLANEVAAVEFKRMRSADVEASLPQKPNLEYVHCLRLSDQVSESLFRKLAAMPSLRVLCFSRCELRHNTPGLLWAWQQDLEFLGLAANPLIKLPPADRDLVVRARSLDLTACELNEAGGQSLVAPNLSLLNISQCRLKEFPDLTQCPNLKIILADANHGIVPDPRLLPQGVEEITLRACRLHEFPMELLKLRSLKRLTLAANRIQSIPWQEITASSLEGVDLSSNDIKDIGEAPPRINRSLEVILTGNPFSASKELVTRFAASGISIVVKR